MSKNNALEQIKKGEITMRPKWYFVASGVAIITLLIVALCATVYLSSFIFFIVDRDGLLLLPQFGWHGVLEFLSALPWIIIALIAILVVAIERLSLHFLPVYMRPILYSVFGIIVIITITSALLIRGNVHERLERRLPFLEKYYASFDKNLPKDVYAVIADNQMNKGIIPAHDASGTVLTVLVDTTTRLIHGQDIDPGDRLVILGTRQGDTIKAQSVQIISTPSSLPARIESEFKEHDWTK